MNQEAGHGLRRGLASAVEPSPREASYSQADSGAADWSPAAVWLGLLGSTALRAAGAALLPLSGDEAYYYDCSRHLDWCYYDQPGLVIWGMIPFRWLIGDTALAVRMPALLASLLFGFFCWRIILRLGGTNRQALLGWGLLHATPLFFFGSGYASTDVVMTACYAGAVLAAMVIADGERRGWWGFGLAVGLGFLAKYPIVLVLAVLVPALSRPMARAHLRTATPWLAALFGMALTAPVWIWAVQHDWANIRFQLGRVPQSLSPMKLMEFWGASFLLLTPTIGLAALMAWFISRRRLRTGVWDVYRWAVAAPMLFWSLIALRGHIGVHWGGPALMLGVLGVVLCPFKGRRTLVVLGIGTSLLVTGLVISLFLFPVFWLEAEREWREREGRPEKVELDNLFGAQELADEVSRRLRPGELAASDRYSDVHLVSFLTQGQVSVRPLGWGHHGLAALFWDRSEDLQGRDFLVFTTKSEFSWRLREVFDAVEPEPPFAVEVEGKLVRQWQFVRCRNLRQPWPALTLRPPETGNEAGDSMP